MKVQKLLLNSYDFLLLWNNYTQNNYRARYCSGFFFYNIYDTCTLWLYDNWALLNYIQALHEQFLDLNGDYYSNYIPLCKVMLVLGPQTLFFSLFFLISLKTNFRNMFWIIFLIKLYKGDLKWTNQIFRHQNTHPSKCINDN